MQWDDMNEVNEGRHCQSCDKIVIDFSAKSDVELLQFFKTKKKDVCAQVSSDQLNRQLLSPVVQRNWRWMIPLAAVAVTAVPAQAQKLKPIIQMTPSAADPNKAAINFGNQLLKLQTTIGGKVIDSLSGKPLSGVKVRQKDFQNVLAITDSTGKFEMSIIKANIAQPFVFDLYDSPSVEASFINNMIVKIPVDRTIRLGGVSLISENRKPLYIIYSGDKKCIIDPSGMDEIQADWVEKLDVLKDESTIATYGSKAVNGVVLIWIKKAFANRIDFSKKE